MGAVGMRALTNLPAVYRGWTAGGREGNDAASPWIVMRPVYLLGCCLSGKGESRSPYGGKLSYGRGDLLMLVIFGTLSRPWGGESALDDQ